MATGDKLVNLDELKLVYDKLHVPSVQVQIPTGQWSGSSTRTYTVNAANVTADTIIDWAMDSSINYLTSDLTVTPGSGTIQFSTTALPAGTINVTLFFPGVKGEVVIQTLADVYSKSQVDTLLAAKVSTSNIVNNLTSTDPTKVLGAPQGKALNDTITPSDVSLTISSGNTMTYVCKKASNIIYLAIDVTERSGTVTFVLPSGARPGTNIYVPMINSSGVTNGYLYLRSNGNCTASIVGTATATYIPGA